MLVLHPRVRLKLAAIPGTQMWCCCRTTPRVIIYIACCILSCGVSFGKPAGTRSAQLISSDGGDVVCGPRCLQYVLDYYDAPGSNDLLALIKEVQWPHIESGASVAAISRVLTDRGIDSTAIELAPSDLVDIVWPHPVILHFKPHPNSNHELGHFVIWLPVQSPVRTHVWNGLSASEYVSSSELQNRLSGIALLTRPRGNGDNLSQLRALPRQSMMDQLGLPQGSVAGSCMVFAGFVVTIYYIVRHDAKTRGHHNAN
jgi:hypothetical protein